MPPNLQRYLPFLLVLLLVLFIGPSLFRHKSGSGLSAKTLAAQTIDAANLIDQAETSYRLAHGRFVAHLADLLPRHPRLVTDLAGGIVVALDASSDGQTYVQQVEDAYLSIVRSRSGNKLIASSCLVIKSGSGVSCPSKSTAR